MTATTDFDRLLTSWLETTGPSDVDAATVELAVASARRQGQRRGWSAALAGAKAWPRTPGRRSRVLTGRVAIRIAIVALVVAAAAGVAIVGSEWLRLRLAAPLVVQGTLTPAGSLSTNRDLPVALALSDGRIFVGGYGSLDETLGEIVDVTTGATRSIPSEAPGSSVEGAALLPDGRVLLIVWVWDGAEPASDGRSMGRILDPSTGTLTPTGPMQADRFDAAVAPLRNGRILVSGGIPSQEPTSALASAEIFDPTTDTFVPTGSLTRDLSSHVMTPLDDGRVLVTGGYSLETGGPETPDETMSRPVETAQLFDPATGRFSDVGSPTGRVGNARPVRLPDGRVLVFGQDGMHCGRHGIDPTTALLFDPVSAAFGPAPRLPHAVRTGTALSDGRVLVTGSWTAIAPAPGGCASGSTYTDDDWLGIYDPKTGVTLESRDPFSGRSTLAADTDHPYGAAVPLPDGRVILIANDLPADGPPPPNAIDIFR